MKSNKLVAQFPRLLLLLLGTLLIISQQTIQAAESPSSAEPGVGSTWYSALQNNPNTLFPLTSVDAELNPLHELLFEDLLDRNKDTYEWEPLLASKWEVSPDGKQFTFWIDPRAKFQDGSPVTATDVKFSYDMIFMPGMATAALKPYYENIDKVTIVAPDQVRFTTKENYFKNFDVCAGLTIFSKKHYEKLVAQDKTMTKAEVTKTPMGTSAWQIERWDENQQLILKRNPNYWNKAQMIATGQWNWDRRVIRIIQDENVIYETFRKGDLSLHSLRPRTWALNSDGPEFKTRITKVKASNKAPVGYGYLAWNQTDPILANKDVRWALSHLVNLPLWIKKFDFDLYEPTVGPYSPKAEDHDPNLKPVAYSLEKARERLAAAGWSKAGKDGVLEKDGQRFEIQIMYPVEAKDVYEPKLTEYKNTAAKVGVAIKLKAVEWTSFQKLLTDRKFQAVTLAWTRSIDPDLKQIWHSDSISSQGSNFIGYKNAQVDKLIDEQRKTLPAERQKRIELSRQIEKLIYDDQPYTFLTEPRYALYAHQNKIKKEKDTYNYTIGTNYWKLTP